jgi:hypothetical protein
MTIDKLRTRVEALERIFPVRSDPAEDWVDRLVVIIQKMGNIPPTHKVVFRCYVTRSEELNTLLQSAVKHHQAGRAYTVSERDALDSLIYEIRTDDAAL